MKYFILLAISFFLFNCGNQESPLQVSDDDLNDILPVISSLYPLNNDTIISDSLLMSWNIDSVDISEISISLYLSQDSIPVLFQENIEDSLFTLYFKKSNLINGMYFWKLKIIYKADTIYSPIMNFIYNKNSKPFFDSTSYYPIDNSIIDLADSALQFTWNASDIDNDSLFYKIEVYDEDKINSIEVSDFMILNSYSFDTSLFAPGLKLSWKVIATDGKDTITSDFMEFSFKKESLVWHWDSLPYEYPSLTTIRKTLNGRLICGGKINSYATIWYSDDNAKSWTEQKVTAAKTSSTVQDMILIGNDSIIVSGTGGDYSYEAIFISSNGGKDWLKSGSRFDFNVQRLFLDATTGNIWGSGLSFGKGAWVVKSINNGASWSKISIPVDYPTGVFAKGENLWLTNSTKDIYSSVNGGTNWVKKFVGFDSKSIYFLNDSKGYVVSSLSTPSYHYTEDGGKSWKATSDTTILANTNDIKFMTDKLGFACGSAGIYVTKDGGITWDNYYDSSYHPANPLWFNKIEISGREVWFVSGKGWIVHTTVPESFL